MIIRLRNDENVIDIKKYNSNTKDLRKIIKNEYRNIASSEIIVKIIELKNDDFDVQIIWFNLENYVINITNFDDEQFYWLFSIIRDFKSKKLQNICDVNKESNTRLRDIYELVRISLTMCESSLKVWVSTKNWIKV